MFNTLNTMATRGKKPPLVCKFLDSLSGVFHGVRPCFGGVLYVLEGRELRGIIFAGVGLRIAFSVVEPVLIRIPSGKG
jgi:hypothetical protein